MEKVTILIPNYKTPKLTKLCLRLLRKNTDFSQVKIIVIDNHSEDESIEYLRTIPWITLIERQPEDDDTPPLSHSRALDMAMGAVTTPYILSIHSDTFMKNPKWLDFLLGHIDDKPNVAGVGSWKLESKPFVRRLLKSIERGLQLFWYTITFRKDHVIQGAGKNYYYLRSHCALYRTDLLKKFNLMFSMEKESAGKVLHKKLLENNYDMIFLPSETLGQYIDHVNHATTVLNPQLGSRKKSITKGEKRIKKALDKIHAEEILKNDELDSQT